MDGSLQPPLLPVFYDGTKPSKRKESVATGTYAATVRALSARALGFWFRAPVRAFFRTRVDYMGYVRAINPNVQTGAAFTWRQTSPALLAHAVRTQGWSFLPNQVLPPLLANTLVGAVCYATYLQALANLDPRCSGASKRVYPPPSFATTCSAGVAAGAAQSLVAAPVDALQVRFHASEIMSGKYKNMWTYAVHKTHSIGIRGVFAGWSLSCFKDSIGYGLFFGTFEFVKSQCFYTFVSNYYKNFSTLSSSKQAQIISQQKSQIYPTIEPHYMLEPGFILLAGVAAGVMQQVVQHPLSRIQEVHYGRMAFIDAHRTQPHGPSPTTMHLYKPRTRRLGNKSWSWLDAPSGLGSAGCSRGFTMGFCRRLCGKSRAPASD